MRLVLYSGGDFRENKALNRAAFALTGRSAPSMTYIPSSSDYGRWDFPRFVSAFDKLGASRLIYFPIDVPFTRQLESMALRQDIVFLSGGNTFYFLHQLRSKKLLPKIQAFVSGGGVLAGLSAGAIMMSGDIRTAGYPHFDRDKNDVGIRDLSAMGLVDFEFFPHYQDKAKYRAAFDAWTRRRPFPLYACPDRSGVVIADDRVKVLGRGRVFFNGRSFRVGRS